MTSMSPMAKLMLAVIACAIVISTCVTVRAQEEQAQQSARQPRTLFRIFNFLDNLADRFVETFLSSQPQPGLFQGGQQAANRNSAIGAVCRYSEECRGRTSNSVCYNGRCLCSIGYHYSSERDDCLKDITCPACSTEVAGGSCLGGMDLFCNGTCIGADTNSVEDADKLSLLEVGLDKKQISTPNWPHNYPYSTDRFYCLTATSGRRVNLDFRWMDLETNCGMENCDYVKVYDGCMADDRTNLLAFYNGDNSRAQECVTSVCNKMLVHFHSDAQKENKRADSRSGVMAYYKAVPYGQNPCSNVDNNLI